MLPNKQLLQLHNSRQPLNSSKLHSLLAVPPLLVAGPRRLQPQPQHRRLTLGRATAGGVLAESLTLKQISQAKSSPAAGMALVIPKLLPFKK